MDQGQVLEAQRLSRAMETTRARITGTVGELRENVTRAVDWREQVKTHPGAALATAGAVGLLLAYWVSAPSARTASGAPVRPSAPADEHSPPGSSVLRGSWTRAGSRLSDLVNRVIDEVGDTVEKAAIPPLIGRIRGFLPAGSTASDPSCGGSGREGLRKAPGV
jgi:hypothetical protein